MKRTSNNNNKRKQPPTGAAAPVPAPAPVRRRVDSPPAVSRIGQDQISFAQRESVDAELGAHNCSPVPPAASFPWGSFPEGQGQNRLFTPIQCSVTSFTPIQDSDIPVPFAEIPFPASVPQTSAPAPHMSSIPSFASFPQTSATEGEFSPIPFDQITFRASVPQTSAPASNMSFASRGSPEQDISPVPLSQIWSSEHFFPQTSAPAPQQTSSPEQRFSPIPFDQITFRASVPQGSSSAPHMSSIPSFASFPQTSAPEQQDPRMPRYVSREEVNSNLGRYAIPNVSLQDINNERVKKILNKSYGRYREIRTNNEDPKAIRTLVFDTLNALKNIGIMFIRDAKDKTKGDFEVIDYPAASDMYRPTTNLAYSRVYSCFYQKFKR